MSSRWDWVSRVAIRGRVATHNPPPAGKVAGGWLRGMREWLYAGVAYPDGDELFAAMLDRCSKAPTPVGIYSKCALIMPPFVIKLKCLIELMLHFNSRICRFFNG